MGAGVLVVHHAQGLGGGGTDLGVIAGEHVGDNGVEGIVLANLAHAGNRGQSYLLVLVVGQLDEGGLFSFLNCFLYFFQLAHNYVRPPVKWEQTKEKPSLLVC